MSVVESYVEQCEGTYTCLATVVWTSIPAHLEIEKSIINHNWKPSQKTCCASIQLHHQSYQFSPYVIILKEDSIN